MPPSRTTPVLIVTFCIQDTELLEPPMKDIPLFPPPVTFAIDEQSLPADVGTNLAKDAQIKLL